MHHCLIDTALGTMGLGWTGHGVARLVLPGAGTAARAAIGGAAAAVPAALAPVVARVAAYAAGEHVEFTDVALDLGHVPEFHRRVYDHIRALRWGETTTYGAIARHFGDVRLARAVGQAMGANPIPLIIPCHRVLAAAGRTGGFSAPGGVTTKMRMLALERASTPEGQFAFGF